MKKYEPAGKNQNFDAANNGQEDLLKTEHEQRQFAEALHRAAAALNSTLDYDKVIDRILEQISQVIPNDAANVMLIEDIEEGTARVFRGRGYEKYGTADTLTSITLNIKKTVAFDIMQQTGQPLVIPDVRDYDGWVYSRPEHTWIKSYAGAPIIVRTKLVGFLNVNSGTANFFNQIHVDHLKAFAHHAGIAIENARLYHQAQQELAERRQAEEEVRQHRDHLEELVAERTTELTRAITEATQLNEQLQQQNAELDAFSHTVAHDLKNPLSLIIGYTKLLYEDATGLETKELELIGRETYKGAKRTANIIDDLLLLASIRKEQVEFMQLDMVKITHQALERLNFMIKEYRADIVLPTTWPAAQGYAPWVEEVWLNYLSNGLKYGGQPPHLELGATRQSDGMVRFWVQDDGTGLTPDEQATLFTEFTRLSKVGIEGYGLGLSIVRRIIDKLGGQVGIESEVGRGSLFYFTLKMNEAKT